MRILLAVGLLLCAVSPALAGVGGEVDFENFSNSLIYINSVDNGPPTTLISGPSGSYYFILCAAETTTTTIDATLGGGRALDAGGWDVDAGTQATNTGAAGYINGNDDQQGPGATLDVGWAAGDQANFAVVGWSANIGDDWGLADAWWNNGDPISGPSGYFGISTVAQDVLVGGGLYPIPTIFGPTPTYEIQGMTLNYYNVPEPSTVALITLGAAGFLIRRPRRLSKRLPGRN